MIEPRLKKLEAIAGTPKTCFALSIPMTSAASETSRMNGHMIRVSKIVSAVFSGDQNQAQNGSHRCGAKMIPSTVTRAHENDRERRDLVRESPGGFIAFRRDPF